MFIISSRFQNRINTALYLCDKEDENYWKLQELSTRMLTGNLRIQDSKTLAKIEKELIKEINDGDL